MYIVTLNVKLPYTDMYKMLRQNEYVYLSLVSFSENVTRTLPSFRPESGHGHE